MSKPVKILSIIGGVILGLVLILIITVKIILSEDTIKSMVVPLVEKELNRTLTIGSASVSIFPSVAIELKNITLSDDPNFSDRPFATLNEFRLGVKLLPLLSKKIMIDEIVVDGLTVKVICNRDGILNIASMSPQQKEEVVEEKTDESSSSDFVLDQLAIESFSILNTNLSYIDQKSGNIATINELDYILSTNFHADSVILSHQLLIPSFSYGTEKIKLADRLKISLNQQLTYHLTHDQLSLSKSDFSINNLMVHMSGNVVGVQDSIRQLDIKVFTDETDLKEFLKIVPPSIVKEITQLQTKGKFQFSTQVKGTLSASELPSVNYQFKLADGYFKYSSLPAALEHVQVNFLGTLNSFDLTQFQAKIKNSTVHANATVIDFKNPQLTLSADLNFSLDDVKDFYPLDADSITIGGAIVGKINAKGFPLQPKTMVGSGRIDFKNLQLKQKSLPKGIQSINGTFLINNHAADLQRLQLIVGQSDIEITGKMENYMGLILAPETEPLIPKITGNLRSQKFVVGDFVDLDKVPAEEKVEEVHAKATMPILPEIDASFHAEIKEFWYKDIKATNTTTQVNLKNQRISLTQTKTNVFGGEILLGGTVDLTPETPISFKFDTKANNIKATELLTLLPAIEEYVQMGKYLSGDLNVVAGINGALTDSLTPDLAMLSALGSLGIPNGNLSGHPIQNSIADFLSVAELKNLSVTDWKMGMEIKDGKLYVKDLKTSAMGAEIKANGWQSLDKQINYELTLHLPKWMTEKISTTEYGKVATSYFTDDQDRIIIDVNVTGTFSEPKVEPDVTRSASRAAGAVSSKVKKEVDKKVEEVKDQAKEAIDQKVDEAKQKVEEKTDELKKKAEEEIKNKLKKIWP